MAKPRRPADPTDNILAGRRPVLEILRAGRPVERILVSEGLAPSSSIGEIRKSAEHAGVPVRVVPREQIDRLAGGANHQGVLAVAGRYRYSSLESMLAAPTPAVLFLDGVMDPHNLGSLMRSAEVAGFDGVVIRARRAVGVTAAVRRVSTGAAEVLPVARVDALPTALERARSAGLWIVGLDEKGDGEIWTSSLVERPVALVLGAEDKGLSRPVAAACDALVRIPVAGRISSLNVAVAGAIAMFEVARRTGGNG